MHRNNYPNSNLLVPVLGKERNTASRLAVTLPPHKRLGRRPLRLPDHEIKENIEKGENKNIYSRGGLGVKAYFYVLKRGNWGGVLEEWNEPIR